LEFPIEASRKGERMTAQRANKKPVLTEYESNVVEIREEEGADEIYELNHDEMVYENARRQPFVMMFVGAFVAWLGYHWVSPFTTYLKSGAMGAGGVIMFLVYPLLGGMVLTGLGMIFKGLKALFSSR
jgi:hypothetical protein